jgi:hypothetical protein
MYCDEGAGGDEDDSRDVAVAAAGAAGEGLIMRACR